MKHTSSGFFHQDTYIALDSDLVICFAQMYNCQKQFNLVTKSILKQNIYAAQNNFDECKFVFDSIMNGTIKPVVTNSIFNEISGSIYGQSGHLTNNIMIEFLTTFCYAPKPNELLSKRRRDEIQVLAKRYCLPYKDKSGKKDAPMNFTYNAYLDMTVPENDAVAMAEATCLNVYFLTYNGKHFVWKNTGYFSDDSAPLKARTVGIIEINKQNNYFTKLPTGCEIVPKPMHLRDFVNAVKNCDGGIQYFDCSMPETNKLVKLGELIDIDEFNQEIDKNINL